MRFRYSLRVALERHGGLSMRVLVTGASGRIGSEVCRSLAREKHEVIATDMRSRDDLPVKVHAANLLDRHAVSKLAQSIDACVHLGNHIDFIPPDPQMIFGENMTININVMQAAHDGGAKKIVFASSIQAFSSVPSVPDEASAPMPEYLPFDSDVPARPTNPYGVSKVCGEEMLRYYSRVFGTQTIALRFPWTLPMETVAENMKDWEKRYPWQKRMAFTYLSTPDAGDLVAAILRADLPGFRIYMPSSKKNMEGRSRRELIAAYYKDTPIRGTFSGESFVDISRIERETGWSPKD